MQDRLGLLANWKPSKFWNEAHSYHFYYEGSAEDMKDLIKTEELDILKEHTEELLAPLADTSGTGHPQRHQNVQTEAWLVLQHLHVPISQLFHLKASSSGARRAPILILPDAEGQHSERCMGDGTRGD